MVDALVTKKRSFAGYEAAQPVLESLSRSLLTSGGKIQTWRQGRWTYAPHLHFCSALLIVASALRSGNCCSSAAGAAYDGRYHCRCGRRRGSRAVRPAMDELHPFARRFRAGPDNLRLALKAGGGGPLLAGQLNQVNLTRKSPQRVETLLKSVLSHLQPTLQLSHRAAAGGGKL